MTTKEALEHPWITGAAFVPSATTAAAAATTGGGGSSSAVSPIALPSPAAALIQAHMQAELDALPPLPPPLLPVPGRGAGSSPSSPGGT
jgi:hypothetical protein